MRPFIPLTDLGLLASHRSIMKALFTLFFSVLLCTGYCQTSTTEVQTIDIQLVNVIKLKFVNTGTTTGPSVVIPLNNVTDMMTGVSSANQKLSVASTKPFNVNVKAASTNFTYSGTYQTNTAMPVNDVLLLKVNQNNTGGSISNSFNSFQPIEAFAQSIINGGDNGVNKTFRIKYKAIPDLQYPMGTYNTSVIFTASQQ
jgi:hypothetical protein